MSEGVKSIHPYAPYISEGATRMIIGTMPPYRFCVPGEKALFETDVAFYYGSKDNCFWDLMAEITDRKLQYVNSQRAIDERKDLLDFLGIGIADIVKECVHQDGKSDDASLKDIVVNRDLVKELSQHPAINTLIYTSKFVTKQMNKISDKGYHERWDKTGQKGFVQIGGKEYTVYVLYSPSPNALRGVSAQNRLAQYKTIFGLK